MEREFRETLTLQQVSRILKLNEQGINIVQGLLALIFALWLAATMIPGLDLYDGTANRVSAFTHAGFWAVIQFAVVYMGASVPKFGIHYSERDGVIEKGIKGMQFRLQAYQWALVIGILAHIVHAILMGMETQLCDSTLCHHYTWAFYTILVLICLQPFLHAWQIYRVYVFSSNFEWALKYNKAPMDILGGKKQFK